FGFLFALYLIYLQFFVIKSFCQYCLVVDFSTIIMFFLSLKLKNE
ncbi:MAG: vitamin K epoxide reductase, partial [Patescibacteria group bacterium]